MKECKCKQCDYIFTMNDKNLNGDPLRIKWRTVLTISPVRNNKDEIRCFFNCINGHIDKYYITLK